MLHFCLAIVFFTHSFHNCNNERCVKEKIWSWQKVQNTGKPGCTHHLRIFGELLFRMTFYWIVCLNYLSYCSTHSHLSYIHTGPLKCQLWPKPKLTVLTNSFHFNTKVLLLLTDLCIKETKIKSKNKQKQTKQKATKESMWLKFVINPYSKDTNKSIKSIILSCFLLHNCSWL